MNARSATLLVVVLLLLVAFTAPAAGKQGDAIVVDGADEVRTASVSIAQGLTNRLANVTPRIVSQYANQLRHIGLTVVPGPLQTLLDQLSSRVVVQYANAIRRESLPAIPAALQTLLGRVSDRVVFQYANANRQESLLYPVALFGDNTPPQISGITAKRMGSENAAILWTTDEFGTSVVLYGTQQGVYPHTVDDPLYTKQHEVTLTGLTAGTRYYYQVRSTDRSGNTSASAEHSLSAQTPVYLPLLKRNAR